MKALGDAYSTDGKDVEKSKEIGVEVAPFEKLARPVKLDSIKRQKLFKDFLLLKISRLSVMPVSEEQWKFIISTTRA